MYTAMYGTNLVWKTGSRDEWTQVKACTVYSVYLHGAERVLRINISVLHEIPRYLWHDMFHKSPPLGHILSQIILSTYLSATFSIHCNCNLQGR
jgi:hypothetical protein